MGSGWLQGLGMLRAGSPLPAGPAGRSQAGLQPWEGVVSNSGVKGLVYNSRLAGGRARDSGRLQPV